MAWASHSCMLGASPLSMLETSPSSMLGMSLSSVAYGKPIGINEVGPQTSVEVILRH